ncbi:phosphoribosyltransferase [Microlunatus sp. GCM10028923]|uniref:phosphoribosyltransferase n=1 Tax=Microlunatus sp. GCM10028923 TaxID=3273400 RepID=UPI0036076097
MISSRYADRAEAGRRLAALLDPPEDPAAAPTVLALPRGGVPVAAPIAERFGVRLDIVAVRKLGVPDQPELAMGALARIGDRVEHLRNDRVIAQSGVTEPAYQRVLAEERQTLDARHQALRGDRPALELTGRPVIIVDDGLATGTTMLVAIEAVRRCGAASVTAVVPVASEQAARLIADRADRLVCPSVPAIFRAVGQAYRDFDPIPEAEARRILNPER